MTKKLNYKNLEYLNLKLRNIIWDVIKIIKKLYKDKIDILIHGSRYWKIQYHLANFKKFNSDLDIEIVYQTDLLCLTTYQKMLNNIIDIVKNKIGDKKEISLKIYPSLVKISDKQNTIDLCLIFSYKENNFIVSNRSLDFQQSINPIINSELKLFVKNKIARNVLIFIKHWIALYRTSNLRIPKGAFLNLLVINNFKLKDTFAKPLLQTIENIQGNLKLLKSNVNYAYQFKNHKLILNYDVDQIFVLEKIISDYLEIINTYGVR